jgi:hypothetical protein
MCGYRQIALGLVIASTSRCDAECGSGLGAAATGVDPRPAIAFAQAHRRSSAEPPQPRDDRIPRERSSGRVRSRRSLRRRSACPDRPRSALRLTIAFAQEQARGRGGAHSSVATTVSLAASRLARLHRPGASAGICCACRYRRCRGCSDNRRPHDVGGSATLSRVGLSAIRP